jgi:hypothetical protein
VKGGVVRVKMAQPREERANKSKRLWAMNELKSYHPKTMTIFVHLFIMSETKKVTIVT